MSPIKVRIVVGYGPDKLFMFFAGLPDPITPSRALCATVNAPAGAGEAYAKQHFPNAVIEVMNANEKVRA